MSDNYIEYSSKCDSLKPQEDDDESKIANFKLFYQNTKNPERDKSSGVSSDDETTSSSLVPIPNTLRQMRCDLKKTTIDQKEYSKAESPPVRNTTLEKPPRKVIQSLEEFRKRYTLLNENSVSWKMNSANSMLDDILNCTNVKNSINDKEVNFTRLAGETETETETSNTEITCTVNTCAHFPNGCIHSTAPLNFSSPCQMHNRAFQSVSEYCSSLGKGQLPPQCNENNRKGKSLGEKIQNLKGIRAMYQTFLKTKSPFTKSKETERRQGIPNTNYKNDTFLKNEPNTCKCEVTSCHGMHYPKMIFDLVEPSENSDVKSTEREKMKCTCNKLKCNCPEVIPKCICPGYACQVVDCDNNPQIQNSEIPNICENYAQGDGKAEFILKQKNEEEYSVVTEKDEGNKNKQNSLNNSSPGYRKYCSKERKYIERTDIYYFDHGNSGYYQTTDNHPLRYTECLVERTDEYATKFWAEIFGFISIGIAFLISFILQLYRFLFANIIRSLTVGLLQIFSDYFFKPLLTVIFNGIIQPCLILAYNVATSVRDLCLPISQIFGFFTKEIANIFRACRIVEINHDRLSCNCGNKV